MSLVDEKEPRGQSFSQETGEKAQEPEPWTTRPLLIGADGPGTEFLQWYKPPRRAYTRRELLADRIVNFTGAGASWVALPVIAYASYAAGDPVEKQVGFWVHGVCLMIMLTNSAVYHYLAWQWHMADKLLALDHVGITCMIMGAYVPMMLQIGGFRTLALVITLGLLGVSMEAYRVAYGNPTFGRWSIIDITHIVRYLVMGWSCLLVIGTMISDLPAAMMIMVGLGGVMFSGGVFFFVSGKEFHLSIWHSFVVVASFCFYFSNLLFLVGLPYKY